jgi:serine/threonine-protein kinase
MGTPDYMSPEQARGLSDLDQRTDIYSMGVILYEMIANRMPYEQEAIGDLIAAISRDPPTPVTKHRPDVPPELVHVIERAMARDREDRFPDAREMRNALVDIWGGAFEQAASGVTSLSEMPPPPEGAASGRHRRASSQSGKKKSASGARPNPALPRHPSHDGPTEIDVVLPEARSAEDLKALGDAPTLLSLEAVSVDGRGSPAPASGVPREEPRSMGLSIFAGALASMMLVTFVWVWIAGSAEPDPGEGGFRAAAAALHADGSIEEDAATDVADAGVDAGEGGELDHEGVSKRGKRRGGRPPIRRPPIRRPTKRGR